MLGPLPHVALSQASRDSHAIDTGVPAGGPSEPLVDDGSEGAGPSAAPPVTAQDFYSSYAALILGTGTFCLPLAILILTSYLTATYMPWQCGYSNVSSSSHLLAQRRGVGLMERRTDLSE